MRQQAVSVVFALFTFGPVLAGEKPQLPPEVTPELRAACEEDVRRLCGGANPTIDSVKSCVQAKFRQLGRSCQFKLAQFGLGR